MAKRSDYTRYVAFLRGMNLGKRRIAMEDLRALFVDMKFANVWTFIASGNVVFDTVEKNAASLEKKIEGHLASALGYAVDTFLRTPAEIEASIAFRPFSAKELETPGHTLHVVFLRSALDKNVVEKLDPFRTTMDDLCVQGRELYWLCRGKLTDSLVAWPKLTKAIEMSSTARNVTSLRKLAAKLAT